MYSQSSLPAQAKAGSEIAQFYFSGRRIAHFGALGISLILLFLSNTLLIYGVTVVALLIEIVAWWLRYRGEYYHRLSRELIRWARLEDAFGKQGDSLYITDLLYQFGKKLDQRATQLDKLFSNGGGYYTSDQSKGEARFVENLQESAFFSKHLYSIAAHRTFGLVGLVSLFFIIIFLIAPLILPHERIILIPKLALILLAFVISDELGSAIAWKTAADCSNEVDQHLEKVKQSKLSQEVLLTALGNYATATAAAPPIPKHIYESERERLGNLWNDRKKVSNEMMGE